MSNTNHNSNVCDRELVNKSAIYLSIVVLVALFSPKFFHLISVWLSSTAEYSDDVFSQVAYLPYITNLGNFENDYIAKYVNEALLPFGYRSLFKFLGNIVEPLLMARILSVCLLLLWFAFSLRAAYLLGCRWSLVLVAAFLAASDFIILQIAGGLPHSFSLPLIAIFITAVLGDNRVLLLALVPLAAMFYPILCPLFGISAFLIFFFSKTSYSESWLSKLAKLAIVTSLSLLIVSPNLLVSSYGKRISEQMMSDFPEAGVQGRYDAFSTLPFEPLWKEFVIGVNYAYFHGGRFSFAGLEKFFAEIPSFDDRYRLTLVCFLALAGLISIPKSIQLRLMFVILSSCAVYYLSLLVFPYLYFPGRAIEHFVSLLSLILVPFAFEAIFGKLVGYLPLARVSLLSGSFLLLMSTVIPLVDGVYLPISLVRERERGVFDYICNEPKPMMIAGWLEGSVNRIPYVCQKSIFLSFETHQALHSGFIEESRARANLIIAALWGSDVSAVMDLHGRGVTHLLVNNEDYTRSAPEYFEPYSEYLKSSFNQGNQRGFAVNNLPDSSLVYQDKHYRLYSMELIDERLRESSQSRSSEGKLLVGE